MNTRLPAVRPWPVLGERRRAALEARVRLTAERWASHWAQRPGTPTVTVRTQPSATPERERHGTGYGVAGSDGSWLALLWAPRRLAPWAAGAPVAEYSFDKPTAESLWAGLELDLVSGFIAGLLPAALAVPAGPVALAGTAYGDAAAAMPMPRIYASCSFAAPGPVLDWQLSSALVAALLAEAPAPAGQTPLSARRAAVARAPVEIEARVATVQLAVRDLRALRPGDVLVTDAPLEGRIEVRVRGKAAVVAAAALGEVAGKRGLRIEAAMRGPHR